MKRRGRLRVQETNNGYAMESRRRKNSVAKLLKEYGDKLFDPSIHGTGSGREQRGRPRQ